MLFKKTQSTSFLTSGTNGRIINAGKRGTADKRVATLHERYFAWIYPISAPSPQNASIQTIANPRTLDSQISDMKGLIRGLAKPNIKPSAIRATFMRPSVGEYDNRPQNVIANGRIPNKSLLQPITSANGPPSRLPGSAAKY